MGDGGGRLFMSALRNSLSHKLSSGTQTLPLLGTREGKKIAFLQQKREFAHREHPKPKPPGLVATSDLHVVAVVVVL